MSLFSRNKDPARPALADDVPFESLRRTPGGAGSGSRRNSPRSSSTMGIDESEDAAAPLDPAQAAKTRARRRLIGAIALALAAVVFVPMLFDRTQVPPADDIAVQIPDRDTPFEGRRGVPDANKGPLRPSSPLPAPLSPWSSTSTPVVTPGASTSANTEAAQAPVASVDASRPASEAASEKAAEKASVPSAEKAAPKAADKASEKGIERTAEKNVDRSGEKAGAASTPVQGDDPRALAALEGKAVPSVSESTSGKGFAVQIAAYSAADKAKSMRDQLTANGLKAYTEPLSTPQGLRTRVRLGPFASREAAERARQKLRTMKLDGSVVTL